MFQRVILAIDDSAAAPVATSFAIALAHAGEIPGAVHVVHVNEYLVGGRGHAVETEVEAAEIVNTSVADLKSAGVDATGETRLATCFTVAPTITSVATQWGADVIVVGSRRHRRPGARFGRGVRERLAQTTHLPVMVAPPPIELRRRGLHLHRTPADRLPTPTAVSS